MIIVDNMLIVKRPTQLVVINKTPHDVNYVGHGINITLAACKDPARVDVTRATADHPLSAIFNINLTVAGELKGLPEEREGTYYIVSSLILDKAITNRSDLIAPDDLLRTDDGKVYGCKAFKPE